MYRRIPRVVHERMVSDFVERWEGYDSPSQAARVIAAEYGVTVETVRKSVMEAGVWPVMPAREYSKLAEENARLRAQIVTLGHTPCGVDSSGGVG
ncbi:hypothetical protein Cocul_00866 [Corynebacterium oculi]|uniref:Uncharacterized protein n=1 Tax=Corynebacterium oculi TaxID=1544416 RepID=A0A0Q1ABN2_9CORY|nr:hypothetical protein Cocul_00866 [Corynebacterium oculi]